MKKKRWYEVTPGLPPWPRLSPKHRPFPCQPVHKRQKLWAPSEPLSEPVYMKPKIRRPCHYTDSRTSLRANLLPSACHLVVQVPNFVVEVGNRFH